jgi:hypothetical protein
LPAEHCAVLVQAVAPPELEELAVDEELALVELLALDELLEALDELLALEEELAVDEELALVELLALDELLEALDELLALEEEEEELLALEELAELLVVEELVADEEALLAVAAEAPPAPPPEELAPDEELALTPPPIPPDELAVVALDQDAGRAPAPAFSPEPAQPTTRSQALALPARARVGSEKKDRIAESYRPDVPRLKTRNVARSQDPRSFRKGDAHEKQKSRSMDSLPGNVSQ